jgi:NAD(P)-dependent dehydrogenase (short-subunit alcohol dehydrogenase family)
MSITMKKVVIVTGGSRGIGAATAILAADRGYAVCISYPSHFMVIIKRGFILYRDTY